MPAASLYPPAAAVTIARLAAGLAAAGPAVPVVGQVPNPRPSGKFVLVSRLGGPEVYPRLMDGAQITIDCWAATAAEAEVLANLCRKVIHEMVGTAPVHHVEEIGGPSDLPDPVSNQPRWTYTVQIQMRGSAA